MFNRPRPGRKKAGTLVVFSMVWGLIAIAGPPSGLPQEPPAQPAAKTQAAEKSAVKPAEKPSGAPVIVNDKVLFYIRSRILSISPENRAALIKGRLLKLVKDPLFDPSSLRVAEEETTADIVAKDITIMSVTEKDAEAADKTRLELANEYLQSIRAAVETYRREYNFKTVLLEVLLALLATAALALILVFTRKFFFKLYAKLRSWENVRLRGLRFQKLQVLSAVQMTTAVVRLAKLLRGVLIALVLYAYLLTVLSLFPFTRKFALAILNYVLSPLSTAGKAFLSYLPKLFSIAVIVVITYYVTKLVRFLFSALERGYVSLPGFFPDWAIPTYKVVRFLIIVFAGVVIFPLLPGSDSSAFKGISIFLGALISLGSAGAISNVISGILLTYTRAFRVGDRVQISATIGDVTEKTLLVTRIRTIKNEEITIPNALVLGSHITNYSTSAQNLGLILHTTVTIGYDAPWRQVHELLMAAALATEGILAKPAPFVLQTSLDDSYVSYEVNAYSDQPNKMAVTYARLRENIQDKFNEAGIEIMSPRYAALRDGNPSAMPEGSAGPGSASRAFRIFGLEKPDRKPRKGRE